MNGLQTNQLIIHSLLAIMALAAPFRARADEPKRDDRLVQLLRELADEAYTKFVVRDERRRVYGMAYEFADGDRQIQDFGLDAMHDGAWLMSAMITAHRIDPEGGYLEKVQKYQVPFYVNMLTNSDRLFPHMLARPDQEKFTSPIKGWAPRGWDDGLGIDLVAQQPFSTGVVSHKQGTVVERDEAGKFQHAYFTSSHHLFQDLADSLMNVWLTTRDPQVARAILLIDENRQQYGFRIPVVRATAGMANDLPRQYARPREPEFDPKLALRPLWQGIVLREAAPTNRYDDNLAWTYGDECARAVLASKPIAPGFVANGIGRVYSQMLATKAYFGAETYRHGFMLDPGGLKFEKDSKRLAGMYDGKRLHFSRGIQFTWIAAALLPDFKNDPSSWQAGMKQLAAEGNLAKIEQGAKSLGVEFSSDPQSVSAELDAYVLGTIDYWADVRKEIGYLPRGYRPGLQQSTHMRYAELGAYAHLMKAIAYRLMDERGVSEHELIRRQTPADPLTHQPLPASVLKTQGLE